MPFVVIGQLLSTNVAIPRERVQATIRVPESECLKHTDYLSVRRINQA